MMQEFSYWLDTQNINYKIVDDEVADIPDFGKVYLADLSGVESIFKSKDDHLQFNLPESPKVLIEEEIFYVAFQFGNNWYYSLQFLFKQAIHYSMSVTIHKLKYLLLQR